MRKVAGTLKLELSQYRDLEAFAQFGSELDPDTQRTLARGERLVKTLNQTERQPDARRGAGGADLRRPPTATSTGSTSTGREVPHRAGRVAARQRARADEVDRGGDWSERPDELDKAIASTPRTSATTSTRRAHPLEDERAPPGRRSEPRGAEPAAGRSRGREGGRRHGLSRRPDGNLQRDVRNRIASVKNIQKITRAMEMVAAARLRRAEQRIEALRPYADAIRRDDPAGRRGRRRRAPAADPDRARARSTRVGLLVVTGDRGLAGAFNSNVGARRRRRRARARGEGRRRSYFASGRRPASSLTFRGLDVPQSFDRLHRPPGLRRRAPDRRAPDGRLRRRRGRPGRDLLQRLHLAAVSRSCAARRCCRCSRPRCSTTRSTTRTRDPERRSRRTHALSSTSPTPRRSSSACVPDYVEISIYRALLESTASEHGARMTAMRNASENAEHADRRLHAGDEPGPPGGDHAGDHGSRRRRRRPRLGRRTGRTRCLPPREQRPPGNRARRTSAGSRRSRAS